MRGVLVVNPRATTTTPRSRASLVAALGQEIDLAVVETTHRGHAGEIAEAVRGGTDILIAHGGDGTVNELVSGLLGPPGEFSADAPDSHPAVAVIPGGSANVFARSLGISPDPARATDQLVAAIREGGCKRISVGVCALSSDDGLREERWFVCNAGLGIDADVIAMMEASRRAGHAVTPMRYLRITVGAYFRWAFRRGPLVLELPDRPPVDGVSLAFVSNCTPWTYFGDRPIITNPGVEHDKGLGVFAATKLGLRHGVALSVALLSPGKTPDTAGSIRVDDLTNLALSSADPLRCQIDGEYVGRKLQAEFLSKPAALSVVAPRLLPN